MASGILPYSPDFVFDMFFYDTSNLTDRDWMLLGPNVIKEGAVLVVRPSKDNAEIEVFDYAGEMLDKYKDDDSIDTVTVTGVGSSDIGAASFARSVADVLGRPVAAIVSGYGVRDVMFEGMGGYFVFGLKNRMLQRMEDMFDDWASVFGSAAFAPLYKAISHMAYIDTGADCHALHELVERNQGRIKNLIGHSKGNLMIANCLSCLEGEGKITNSDIHIITLGCGVELPNAYRNVDQFIGTLDMLGRINTAETEHVHWERHCGHGLARWDPMHMPLGVIIQKHAA